MTDDKVDNTLLDLSEYGKNLLLERNKVMVVVYYYYKQNENHITEQIISRSSNIIPSAS